MPPRVTDFTPLARHGGAGRDHKQQRPVTARGVVAIAPGSETADMIVTVNWRGQTIGEIIPAGNWTPRGTALPAKGDTCLVVYDDEGDAFVPTWDGVTTFPAPESWVDYTMTCTATGSAPSLGNSTVVARYVLRGKLCSFRIYLAPGSTFNGGTGAMSFGLPVTSAAGSEQWVACKLYAAVNTSIYTGAAYIPASSGVVDPFFPLSGTNTVAGQLSNTAPQQPATGNYPLQSGSTLVIQGTYETA